MRDIATMFDPKKTQMVFGPPGTGKTHRLLNMVEAALEVGTRPDRIGFLTFTKRAQNEAITRAKEQFGYGASDLKYFRTFHSFCTMMLGRPMYAGKEDFKNFSNWFGVAYEHERDEDGFSGTTNADQKGNYYFKASQYARVKMMNIRDAVHEIGPGAWAGCTDTAERFHHEWLAYLDKRGLSDWTGLLERFVENAVAPGFDFLFIDEAQDLSPIQWKIVHFMAAHSRWVVLAGDDDQSIYTWAGADPQTLIRLRDRLSIVEVLGKSHRLRAPIYDMSQWYINQVSHRVPKDFQPNDGVAEVGHCRDIKEVRDWLDTGKWLILGRTHQSLNGARVLCDGAGYSYSSLKQGGKGSTLKNAVTNWEFMLRKGGAIYADEAVEMVQWIAKHMQIHDKGSEKKLRDIRDRSPLEMFTIGDLNDLGYKLDPSVSWNQLFRSDHKTSHILANLARGESLLVPRINIATIHESKGYEADNVVLICSTSRKVARASHGMDWDDAHRIMYVGMTRARERLIFVLGHDRENIMPSIYPECVTIGEGGTLE